MRQIGIRCRLACLLPATMLGCCDEQCRQYPSSLDRANSQNCDGNLDQLLFGRQSESVIQPTDYLCTELCVLSGCVSGLSHALPLRSLFAAPRAPTHNVAMGTEHGFGHVRPLGLGNLAESILFSLPLCLPFGLPSRFICCCSPRFFVAHVRTSPCPQSSCVSEQRYPIEGQRERPICLEPLTRPV